MGDNGSGSCINLEAPETIRDLSVLTADELARAAELLQRELEAPQTPACRRLKRVTLRRIELRLGRRGTDRGAGEPRPPRRLTRQIPRRELTPARALDAFLSTLDGWNLDWTDAADIEPDATPVEQLVLPIREAA
jgi:hypothetical protein